MGSMETETRVNDEEKGRGEGYGAGEVLLYVPGGDKHCCIWLLRQLIGD